MLSIQHIEESLSRAYVQAVAGRAGVIISRPEYDYGVDGEFNHIESRKSTKSIAGQISGNRKFQSKVPVYFQLKASIDWTVDNQFVHYKLDVENYNDLVDHEQYGGYLVLILLCLDPDSQKWLELTEEQLLMRKCCYWDYLTGPKSNNRNKVTISIPRTQLLTPQALEDMFCRVKQGLPPK